MSFKVPSNWQWLPFEKLMIQPLRNGIYKSKEFHGRGSKIINMGELFAYPRLKEGVDMKRVELTEKELKSATVQNGDLIFARRSLTAEGAGKCSIILSVENEAPITFESSIIRARLNLQKASPEYYYYVFNSPFGKWLLNTILRQVAVAGITGSDLAKLSVPVPPLDTQYRIVRIARDIDDKIELNRQINQTLEQIAQAIFKSWFVDFDPVKAKIWANENGHDPERAAMCALAGLPYADDALDHLSPEQQQQLATTAALFPDSLEESELGEIPSGWKTGEIGELFELHRGFDLPSANRTDGKYPVYAASGFHGTHSEYKIEPPGVITGRSGVIGKVFLTFEKYWPLNTTLYVRKFKLGKGFFTYFFMKTCDFSALNSGSAVPSLNRNFIHSGKTNIPPESIVSAFESIVDPVLQMQDKNAKNAEKLAQLRDTLLPKLLSGELSVADLPEVADAEANT